VGQVIHFEDRAVARLRERLGAVEEANEDLIAFARGHSGAVASIHLAALAVLESATIDSLLEVVTGRWPLLLEVDCAAIALIVGDKGFRADCGGIERIDPAFIRRMIEASPRVEVRTVEGGNPLFGQAVAGEIRAEALVRIDSPEPFPCGLLVLGQRAKLDLGGGHGSELLLFLGEILAAALRRCAAPAA
jgi:uncharacterized protein YigA (DUF484 family)